MNFTENKILKQNKKLKAFLFVFFAVFAFHLYTGVAHAGYCYCAKPDTFPGSTLMVPTVSKGKAPYDAASNSACNDMCYAMIDKNNPTVNFFYFEDKTQSDSIYDKIINGSSMPAVSPEEYLRVNDANGYKIFYNKNNPQQSCSFNVIKPVESFKCMLLGVLQLLGLLFSAVASLFQWMLNPSNISGGGGLLNQPAVKDVWIMVRDTLNMTFIMVLLFAAFCTVFQVEKWNLKKVWLTILINALLVNFSYPIARFFIDVSNVAMYYFLNNMFSGPGQGNGQAIMASFGEASKISSLLTPENYTQYDIAFILAAIIFTFILGITLFVLAVLFVIRLIALVMLVMFSPIGFVGNIFPEASKFAGDWWSNLFKYSFFGPIMVFMMMVSLRIMQAMPNTWNAAAQANVASPSDTNWVSHAAYYSVPIIILWISMGIAQKMGVEGASAVVGAGKKWGGKAAMLMSGGKFAKDTFGAYQARRKQGDAEKTSNRLGKFLGNQQDHLIGSNLSLTKRGRQHANQRYQADEAAEVAAAAKLHDTANMDPGQLKKLAESKDRFDRAAAHLELAAKGKTEGTEELDKTRNDFGADSQVFKQLQNKVKAYDPVAAYAHLSEKDQREKWKDHVTSNQFEAKKVKENSLKADFLEVAMENGGMTAEDLLELTKKPGNYAKKIKGSMEKIVGNGKHNDTTENQFDRNIQLAYAAATGKIYENLTEKQSAEIIKRLNKDNANLEKEVFAGAGGLAFIKHVNTSKFKEIFENLKKDGSPVALLGALKKAQEEGDKETKLKANQLIAQMKKDPSMRVKFEDIGGKFPEKDKDKEKKRKEKNDGSSDKKTNNPVGFQF